MPTPRSSCPHIVTCYFLIWLSKINERRRLSGFTEEYAEDKWMIVLMMEVSMPAVPWPGSLEDGHSCSLDLSLMNLAGQLVPFRCTLSILLFVQSSPDKLVQHGPLLYVYITKSLIINIKNLLKATFPGVGQGLVLVPGSLGEVQRVSNQTDSVTLSYPPVLQLCTRQEQ